MALLGFENPFRLQEEYSDESLRRRAVRDRIFTLIKIAIFLIVWSFFSVFMIFKEPHEPHEMLISLTANNTVTTELDEEPLGGHINLELKGNIDHTKTMSPRHASQKDPYFEVTLETLNNKKTHVLWKSDVWKVYIEVDSSKVSLVKRRFNLDEDSKGKSRKSGRSESQRSWDDSDIIMRVSFLNHGDKPIGISMLLIVNPVNAVLGVWLGVFLIIFLYVLIAFDITDRAFAGILVSLTAIGILCVLDLRPSFATILSWIDIDTLMLLFGMMIMVSILSDTGLFDYLSLFAYKLSKGNTWLLLFYLYMSTGILSAFLDNVTLVLMMVPVTIRLCEAVGLHTTIVVVSIVIFSNIGGALTPVGDPPNMIIATNRYVVSRGIEFGNFTLHMFPGVFFAMLLGFGAIYLMTRKKIFTGKSDQLRKSILGVEKLLANAKNEEKHIYSRRLEDLKERLKSAEINPPNQDFDENLSAMKAKYKIKDKPLLIKCCIAFGFAILMFLLHAFPHFEGVTLSWAAILSALLLLILTDRKDIDQILDRVEWDTLIFFASLFVLTEALAEIGLIEWVSEKTVAIIMCANKDSQLCVSILLLMWISAFTSAFVGNIPITTMMIKLTVTLAMSDSLRLPFHPLIWAISYGGCLGGNGTLIGASANVVTAGMVNSYGYNINFKSFFYLGFPLMVISMIIATIYLLTVHCLFEWH